ncbi:MAG: hypothetical protein ACRYGP_30435 [Janthinobacterium lividum]
MYVPTTEIQSLIDHASALTVDERRALRTELLQAAAAMGLPVPEPRSASPASGSRWPRIGGADLVVTPNLTVETEEYQRRWRASEVVVWIYALGSPGVQTLAQILALPLFKIGTTEGRIQSRLDELGRDNYGAAYRTPAGLVREPGFGPREWVAEQLPVTLELSPLSPVHPGVRSIGVRLPEGLTASMFERRFAAEVGKASLRKIIGSAGGQALCRDRGVDPARCRRVTEYAFGVDVRTSSEEEFVVFRPRTESDRLVAIAERIIVRFVTGLDQ